MYRSAASPCALAACIALLTSPLNAAEPETALELDATAISEESLDERPTGPVKGYVANRSLTATKTDASLIETPQSISVITRDQMQAQDAQSLNQILRYTAAVIPESRGATARAWTS